jgi:transposase InsO family protein
MPASARRTYDHRLRELVTVAGGGAVNDVSMPRSTVASWTKRRLAPVTTSAVFDDGELQLRARLANAERTLLVLRAVLRLLLVLVRVRGARLSDDRLPEGRDNARIVSAVLRASKVVPRRTALRAIGLTESRFRRWKGLPLACGLDDKSPCPKRNPSRLTFAEQQVMRDYVESNELRHFSLASLALYAKRVGNLCASAATWSRTIRDKGWMRPRVRVHPKSNKLGIRAAAVGELLHVDVTVIRLLDGNKVFLQAVMDNFSRKILSWRISPALETWRTGDLLRDAARLLVEQGLTGVTLNEVGDPPAVPGRHP